MKQSLLQRLLEPGQLSARFQPIFRFSGKVNQVHALEALVRGPSGTNFEGADVLFDYVRRKKAEAKVDRACIATICAAAAALPSNFRLNINVHALTLGESPDFAVFLQKETAKHSLAMHRLTVEIVEHAPTRNIPAMLATIAALRDFGVRIALDDVGLGQSNYRMMLDCHPDYFKLDAYFVQGLCVDQKRRAVVESLVTLADALDSSVVGEGAESLGDLGALEQLGVELVQANILCPPMPAEDLLATGLLQSGLVEFDATLQAGAAQAGVNQAGVNQAGVNQACANQAGANQPREKPAAGTNPGQVERKEPARVVALPAAHSM
ncbi:MAG TPA: EAL domain-containing protein [Terriglobales bacterium]|nr:EAL domain-containing protein [Terriglobales bacterium]